MITPATTIKALQTALAEKKISPQEVISFYHKRLVEHNNTLNCAIEIFDESALLAQNLEQGPLFGIPGLLKGNICQKGRTTCAGSKLLRNYVAPYSATIATNLRQAGGICIGRANQDEFAMGSSGEYSSYGPTKNPWSLDHVPGGSSSGSAASVAAGLVPWAIGTETGGSVRQPASFCNLVGLYPTYGRFSRSGIIALCSSTDQPGPLTRTVEDNAIVASAMSGFDPSDATSLQEPQQDFTKNLTGKLPQGLRVGVLKDALESDGVDDEVKRVFREAIFSLEKMGARIEYVTLPNLKYGISIYFILNRAEAASNLSRFDGSLYGMRAEECENLREMYIRSRHDGFGPEVQRRIMMGNYVLSAGHRDAYYAQANHVRDMIRTEYEQAFKHIDVLISPTASTLPFPQGQADADPLAMYMADYFTVPNCITGLPVIAIPAGFASNGLPVGFQFMGPRLSEGLLYQIAHAYEQEHDHHTKMPQQFS